MEMAALGMTPPGAFGTPSPNKQPRGASFQQIREEKDAPNPKETFRLMSKDESKAEMQKKDFDEFLTKTSRIIERALDNNFDVIGDFFDDDDLP